VRGDTRKASGNGAVDLAHMWLTPFWDSGLRVSL